MPKKRRRTNPVVSAFSAVRQLVMLGMAAAGGWIVYSNTRIDHSLGLPKAIPADRKTLYDPSVGTINYYVDNQTTGIPLVLVHSINAAASAYEMRPLFECFRGKRPAYAIDLPGFGFSARTDREYTPDLFTRAIEIFLDQVVRAPVDLVALSLSSEFAARLANRRPDLVHSLTLISPSGLGRPRGERSSQQFRSQGRSDQVYEVLSTPLWARPLYDLIATRPSIRYFLQGSFNGPIPPGMAEYAFATAHQPGAHYAPLYFISGKLFSPDALNELYARLSVPALVLYDRDPFVGFGRLPELLERNDRFQATRIPGTRGLPHFEKLDETAQAIETFWAGIA